MSLLRMYGGWVMSQVQTFMDVVLDIGHALFYNLLFVLGHQPQTLHSAIESHRFAVSSVFPGAPMSRSLREA